MINPIQRTVAGLFGRSTTVRTNEIIGKMEKNKECYKQLTKQLINVENTSECTKIHREMKKLNDEYKQLKKRAEQIIDSSKAKIGKIQSDSKEINDGTWDWAEGLIKKHGPMATEKTDSEEIKRVISLINRKNKHITIIKKLEQAKSSPERLRIAVEVYLNGTEAILQPISAPKNGSAVPASEIKERGQDNSSGRVVSAAEVYLNGSKAILQPTSAPKNGSAVYDEETKSISLPRPRSNGSVANMEFKKSVEILKKAAEILVENEKKEAGDLAFIQELQRIEETKDISLPRPRSNGSVANMDFKKSVEVLKKAAEILVENEKKEAGDLAFIQELQRIEETKDISLPRPRSNGPVANMEFKKSVEVLKKAAEILVENEKKAKDSDWGSDFDGSSDSGINEEKRARDFDDEVVAYQTDSSINKDNDSDYDTDNVSHGDVEDKAVTAQENLALSRSSGKSPVFHTSIFHASDFKFRSPRLVGGQRA